jgi:hypothetical protein
MKGVRLRPKAQADKALKNYLESNEIIDDETGEPWRPEELPLERHLRLIEGGR